MLIHMPSNTLIVAFSKTSYEKIWDFFLITFCKSALQANLNNNVLKTEMPFISDLPTHVPAAAGDSSSSSIGSGFSPSSGRSSSSSSPSSPLASYIPSVSLLPGIFISLNSTLRNNGSNSAEVDGQKERGKEPPLDPRIKAFTVSGEACRYIWQNQNITPCWMMAPGKNFLNARAPYLWIWNEGHGNTQNLS